MSDWKGIFKKIDDFRWELGKDFQPCMFTSAIIYADEKMLPKIFEDNAYKQTANVACLPGIVGKSLAMPDIHWGYGFCIGAVAAFDPAAGGIISPGGIGYDVNCGIRLVRSDITFNEIKDKLEKLTQQLSYDIPSGVGSEGPVRLSHKELEKVLVEGAKWAIDHGYGIKEDLDRIEELGCLEGADTTKASRRAYERGAPQLGTLGSGNHFLEVQIVEEIYDEAAAAALGLFKGQITVLIHSGSRGFGHQVCTDYLQVMDRAVKKYGFNLPDRQLACAPIESEEGRDYYAAMAAAVNYAFTNRQILMHWARNSFEKILGLGSEKLGLRLVYDHAHNIGKKETHIIDGQKKLLVVHRKGATRAFPAGNPQIPQIYQKIGQPILIPGDMGRYSYVMVATDKAMQETFGSVCHGAGREMSRTKASKQISPHQLISQLKSQGILVRSPSMQGLTEEAPFAYKDVANVVNVVHNAGLARKVAKMRPLGVIKG